MKKYRAIDVARWFLFKNQETVDDMGGDKMTLLKLLKLLYYAEGCSLALRGEGIFDEAIAAWEHGPVVAEVYNSYDDPYNLPFGSEEDVASVEEINRDEETKGILEEVFDVFGKYSAWGLRNMTHEETPWLEATRNGTRLNGIISRDTMKSYFKENYVG